MATQRAPAAGMVTATGAHPQAKKKTVKGPPSIRVNFPHDVGSHPALDLAAGITDLIAYYYEVFKVDRDVRDIANAIEYARRNVR